MDDQSWLQWEEHQRFHVANQNKRPNIFGWLIGVIVVFAMWFYGITLLLSTMSTEGNLEDIMFDVVGYSFNIPFAAMAFLMLRCCVVEYYEDYQDRKAVQKKVSHKYILCLQKEIETIYNKYPYTSLRLFKRIVRIKNRSKQDSNSSKGVWRTVSIYGHMCEIALKTQRLESAVDLANQCIELDSAYAKGYWLRALTFKIKGQTMSFVQDLLDCLQHSKSHTESVLMVIVPVLYSLTLNEIIELKPFTKKRRYTIRKQLVRKFNEYVSDMAPNEPHSQIDLYSKILKLDEICKNVLSPRKTAEIYCCRSEALIKQGDFQRALEDAYCSTRMDADFDEAYRLIVKISKGTKNKASGISVLMEGSSNYMSQTSVSRVCVQIANLSRHLSLGELEDVIRKKKLPVRIGKQLCKLLAAMAAKDISSSVVIYSKCLMINKVGGNFLFPQEHANLFWKRSQSWITRGQLNKALEDALQSTLADSLFDKGYWLTVKIYELKKCYVEAVFVLVDFLGKTNDASNVMSAISRLLQHLACDEWKKVSSHIEKRNRKVKNLGKELCRFMMTNINSYQLDGYNKCLDLNEMCGHFLYPRNEAKLHCGRSRVFLTKGNFAKAMQEAERSIQLDESCAEGYTCRDNVIKHELTNHLEHLETLSLRNHGYETTFRKKMDIIIQMLTLECTLQGTSAHYFRQIQATPREWKGVLGECADRNMYQVLHLVLTANKPLFLEPGRQSERWLDCTTENINITPIVENMEKGFATWNVRLLIELIKRGSDIKGLQLNDGDTAFHCAFEIGIQSGETDLLQYVLEIERQKNNNKVKGPTSASVKAKPETDKRIKTRSDYFKGCIQIMNQFECNASGISLGSVLKKMPEKKQKTSEEIDFVIEEIDFVIDLPKLKPRPEGLSHEMEYSLVTNLQLKKMELARLLIASGRSSNKPKPLTLCSQYYHFAIDLVECGANPRDLYINDGKTQFHAALAIWIRNRDSRLKLFELVMRKRNETGDIPTTTDVNGNTLIHGQIQSKDNSDLVLDAIKLLLKFQVDPLAVDDVLDMLDMDHPYCLDILTLWLEQRVGQLLHIDIATKVVPTKSAKYNVKTEGAKQSENNDKERAIKEEIISYFEDSRPSVWEIKLTDRANKVLHGKRISNQVKKAVFERFQRLRENDWESVDTDKVRTVQGTAKKYNSLLETRATKESRILWEIAMGYSVPENELLSGTKKRPIYEENVFVWDIVLDHDKLHRAIDRIDKCHDRIASSTAKRSLTRTGCQHSYAKHGRLPNTYSDSSFDLDGNGGNLTHPVMPADANEKFYSYNQTLATNAILGDSQVFEYPFEITETECAIIHKNLKAPSTTLLLGRSGTGKTTCCLYRLLGYFRKYWEDRVKRDATNVSKCLNAEGRSKEEEKSATATACETKSQLNQLFITKNTILCQEIERVFTNMSRSFDEEFSHEHNEAIKVQAEPKKLQDVQPAAFPLFQTMTAFLLLLDGSMADPFFKRRADGSLRDEVPGWKRETSKDNKHFEEETLDGDDGDIIDMDYVDIESRKEIASEGLHGVRQQRYRQQHHNDVAEVTFEVFEREFYNKIWRKTFPEKPTASKQNFQPTLIWNEITSFIKGSKEALETDSGHLTEEMYHQVVGRKMAPNFLITRTEVYKLFETYEDEKKRRGMFDLADVVFHLYKRLRILPRQLEREIHQVYVDEVQDFTQAELILLIHCCSNPKALFFTGDTAQTIMRGVSFRFCDVTSIFFHEFNDDGNVMVPKEIDQLTHSYRSHSGILNLAASVVDLLYEFFPDSLDRLKPDQAMYDGDLPVLLRSTEIELPGTYNVRTDGIEFGAQQVIIVVNNEAKQRLLKQYENSKGVAVPNVLTIYEAKGLEFDDVLLYDFFSDSVASREWQVVNSDVIKHLNMPKSQDAASTQQKLYIHRITDDVSSEIGHVRGGKRMRCPEQFDFEKHKMLCSELKYLYTAVTRTRNKLLIYDRNSNKRRHMFDYFEKRNLAKVGDSDNDCVKAFVKRSSKTDWKKQGDVFLKRKKWLEAANCYSNAGQVNNAQCAKGTHFAEAAQNEQNQDTKRHLYLTAASAFLRIPDHRFVHRGALCLHNGGKVVLSERLLEKLEKTN